MSTSNSTLPSGWETATEVKSNWFKFENVGDAVKGTLIARRFQESNTAGFPDQQIYELKDEEGNMLNVGISVKKSGTIQRLNSCKIGEIVGILFESEGEPSSKGFHPAKNLKVLSFGMDPEYKAVNDATSSNDDIPFVN